MGIRDQSMKITVFVVLTCFLSAVALAGTQDQAKLALHYMGTCDLCQPDYCGAFFTPNIPCSEYNTDYFFSGIVITIGYLVLAHGDSTSGVAGVQFGITHSPSFSVLNWYLCGDAEMPHDSNAGESWPSPGSGNRVTWDPDTNCQRNVIEDEGVHVVVGALSIYTYAAGTFSVTPDSTLANPTFIVTDCLGEESFSSAQGGVIGYMEEGFNPCLDSTPVEPSTWGQIKARYGN